MARPSVKIMGPHRSQLRSAADCWLRSLNGNTTITWRRQAGRQAGSAGRAGRPGGCRRRVGAGHRQKDTSSRRWRHVRVGGCLARQRQQPARLGGCCSMCDSTGRRHHSACGQHPAAATSQLGAEHPALTRFFQMRSRSRLIVCHTGSSSVFCGPPPKPSGPEGSDVGEKLPPPPPGGTLPLSAAPLLLMGTEGSAENSCKPGGGGVVDGTVSRQWRRRRRQRWLPSPAVALQVSAAAVWHRNLGVMGTVAGPQAPGRSTRPGAHPLDVVSPARRPSQERHVAAVLGPPPREPPSGLGTRGESWAGEVAREAREPDKAALQ